MIRYKKRPILLVFATLVIIALAGGGFLIATRESRLQVYQLPTIQNYPDVSDLAPDAQISQDFASLSYGVQTFLWWNATYRSWDLENVRQMNFAYVKQNFTWSNIQPEPERWDWTLADEVVAETRYRGRHIVARLDGAPEWAIRPNTPATQDAPPYDLDALATYCGTLASRYAGQIEGYQIWNEPNLTREWAEKPPSPIGYVTLLATCAEAIRTADPDAIIITAGLAPTGTRDLTAMPDEEYLWRMYEAGASPHFDVLGLNAPGYSLPPDASAQVAAEIGLERWARFRHVEDMRAIMVANGDAAKQVAILEMGWTTDARPDSIYAWFAVSQEAQAEYLVGAYAYAAEHWRPWMGLMVTIYISKDIWTQDDEQWWWALDEPAAPGIWKLMRPAYFALANMAKFSDNPVFAEPARDPDVPSGIIPLPPRPTEETPSS